MKEQLEALNAVSINFGQGGMTIVNIILAFVMFGVALGIKTQTFKDVFKNPKSVIVGIFLQWVGLPAVTFAIALALSPVITPMIALGMILVASCPGGNISNVISSLSKGNTELSRLYQACPPVHTVRTTFIIYGVPSKIESPPNPDLCPSLPVPLQNGSSLRTLLFSID